MAEEHKVVVVTGGTGGLGSEIVNAYRRRDYRVVATSKSIKAASNEEYLALPADIADPGSGKRIIDAAVGHFGRVDTLINSAGIFIPKSFEAYTEKDYRDVLTTNLDGFFFVTQHAIKVMLE